MADERYIPGDHNVICDISGFKCKRSECRKTWDGFIVRADFWEPRQSQDFVRGLRDKIAVAPGETRSEGADQFLTTNQVTVDDL